MSSSVSHPPKVPISAIAFDADGLDVQAAAAAYREHGCLVIRGMMRRFVSEVRGHIDRVIAETISLIPEAKKIPEGWHTPNGALLLPAPANYSRDKQIMCLPINYRNSASFFQSAQDPRVLDLVEAVLGPNLELFMEGQSLVKEPIGGHPKLLHQDAAYFQHRYEGPMAMLTYACDVDEQNGCLWVVPGSHKLGVLRHVDTFSHLGLDEAEWPWEAATPIHGKAGDAIFFHVNCIHGSKPNWSDKPRPVFITRYRAADDYVVISATNAAARAERAKDVEKAKKENQLGLMVRGFRDYDNKRER